MLALVVVTIYDENNVREDKIGMENTREDDSVAWQDSAKCSKADPETFFPGKGGSTKDGKKICASCEVRTQCLEHALATDEKFGIWGGLSERERRELRRKRTGVGMGRAAAFITKSTLY